MKKYSYIIIIFLFFLFPTISLAVVLPTDEFYVNDYANILNEETEKYILQRSLALNETDGTQIVVVTVLNLDGMSIEKYANDLFNSFGIGDKDKNNGLLLLLALEEREFRVEVGDGLAGILPDGKTGRFQDKYIIPYLKENDWNNGIRNGYDAFYSEIVELNDLDVDYTKPIGDYSNDEYDVNGEIAFELVPVFLFLSLLCGLFVKKSKNKKRNILICIGIWIVLLILSILYARFLIYILILSLIIFLSALRSSNSHGGIRYYGGRSSSYRSSSSSSSRRFSGGGGRSSGGGSSRRF